jgi:multiple sugar transport system permease protein
MGYGAALTVIYLAIIVLLTLTQARLLERRVHYS